MPGLHPPDFRYIVGSVRTRGGGGVGDECANPQHVPDYALGFGVRASKVWPVHKDRIINGKVLVTVFALLLLVVMVGPCPNLKHM